MRDIAELAGVSRTTVSHALSGRGRVEASTRRRVQEIARKTGFVPSATALALKTGRTGVLAIANATTTGSLEYFMHAATAASYEALAAGYTLALIPPGHEAPPIARLAIDGAIVLDPLRDDPITAALRDRGTPVVTIGEQPGAAGDQGPAIRTDRSTGTALVLDHLRERGSRRPALVISSQPRQWITETREAYASWMRARALEPRILDVSDDPDDRGAYDAVGELVTSSEADAVYVPFDPLVRGVLAALSDLRVSVPREFRVVVQEGMQARTGRPGLTALDDRPDEVARLAMRALIRRLGDAGDRTSPEPVRPTLIVRETT